MAVDRRVARTRRALEGALIELIVEQGFEATTVSQITERADVGRSTFYAHYADKEDLLQGAVETLRELLESAVAEAPERPGVHPALAFCLPMVEHAAEMQPLFRAMVGRHSGDLMLEFAHDVWCDFIRARWEDADELAVQAIAGAFGRTLHWWFQAAPEVSPAEVDRRFRALVEGGLGTRGFGQTGL